ncbi:Holliday junction branch migration protein RuvA [Algimonas porphyrae]|uniref:Holliday junction branch migration complex subunit RuvA n=1 Tax=Algimonas porphyrae TaxID=1128113 RepID=A0ABQ5UVX1_9PROT|nr:Holliday junction branch migration protein RuvA [Algimonas porphyrae]GLQ19421.1 Holliday junction ATP-dependent DNA helicase RuvA [Algimonas porphyrae]
MIGMISGTCLMAGQTASGGEAIIDCGGVGYLLRCGVRALRDMREGAPVRLHVETHVREQSITLFGFTTEEERAWFERLQAVQGVGPKAALAILDILTPGDVMSAAALEDKAAFARASGVGPKLAARIATELSGKPPPVGRGFTSAFTAPTADVVDGATRNEGLSDMRLRNDAVSALSNLGIGQSDALRAVAAAYSQFDSDPALDDLVRAALKAVGS